MRWGCIKSTEVYLGSVVVYRNPTHTEKRRTKSAEQPGFNPRHRKDTMHTESPHTHPTCTTRGVKGPANHKPIYHIITGAQK